MDLIERTSRLLDEANNKIVKMAMGAIKQYAAAWVTRSDPRYRKEMVEAWRDLLPEFRDEVEASMREVFQQEYGASTAPMWRYEDDAPVSEIESRAKSMTDRLDDYQRQRFRREPDEIRLFRVGYDDVMVHYAHPEAPGEMRTAQEQEVILRPDADIEELSDGRKRQRLGLDESASRLRESADARSVADRLESEYGIEVWMRQVDDSLAVLSKIIVPEERQGEGVGSAAMSDLVDWADRHGVTLATTPSGDYGSDVDRLESFYRRFGFVDNDGGDKVWKANESMVRHPEG